MISEMHQKAPSLLKENKVLKELSPYLTLGIEFAFSVLVFVLLGRWLDEKFETQPIYTISFILFSVIGGFVRMFFKINYLGKKDDGNNIRDNSVCLCMAGMSSKKGNHFFCCFMKSHNIIIKSNNIEEEWKEN